MKKQLLFGSALLLSVGAFAQNQKQIFENAPKSVSNRYVNSFSNAAIDTETPGSNRSIGAQSAPANNNTPESTNSSSPILSANWSRLSGSMNIFGMLVSSSKPLGYDRILQTVSFIQRKSGTYVGSPAGDMNSGSIVAYLGKNEGTQWDSTLIFADAANLARYPQGGIYNPAGNANYDNATVVGMGPVTGGSGWIGNWYASKSVTATPKNAAGSDEQFFSNTSPFNSATSATMVKHDFPRYGFSARNTGIWAAATLMGDINGTTNAAQAVRGGLIVKGTFNAGAMVWTPDSIIPPTVLRLDGSKQIWSQPYLAFNESGQVGYAMMIGGRQGSSGSNVGWQPIVYKTTNGGTSWSLVNGIDFNAPGWDFVLNSMAAVNTNSNLAVPFFNVGEGIDMAVDKNDKLHILSTVVGTARNHPDSLGFTWQFTVNGEQGHAWLYQNTAWPYVFDFIGDGTSAWTFKTVDSVGTEGPSATSGQPGFNSNPWANQAQTNAVTSDMRLQITRSYDGEFLAYSWAESDTAFTNLNKKWNEFPNLKVRAYRTCDNSVSTDKYDITGAASGGAGNRVKDKAYFHYMSNEMKAGASTATSATVSIPFTISNNLVTDGGIEVDNFFSMANIGFSFASAACGGTLTTGINSVAKNEADNSRVFPNPTKNSVNVALTLSQNNEISIEVYNAIGQKVSSMKANGQIGENVVNVNLNNATAGVYFVKVKAGASESTKKLIIE